MRKTRTTRTSGTERKRRTLAPHFARAARVSNDIRTFLAATRRVAPITNEDVPYGQALEAKEKQERRRDDVKHWLSGLNPRQRKQALRLLKSS